MLKIDRQKYLDEELHTYGSILISTMSQKLNCSEETIRSVFMVEHSCRMQMTKVHPYNYVKHFSHRKKNDLQHVQLIALLKKEILFF